MIFHILAIKYNPLFEMNFHIHYWLQVYFKISRLKYCDLRVLMKEEDRVKLHNELVSQFYPLYNILGSLKEGR